MNCQCFLRWSFLRAQNIHSELFCNNQCSAHIYECFYNLYHLNWILLYSSYTRISFSFCINYIFPKDIYIIKSIIEKNLKYLYLIPWGVNIYSGTGKIEFCVFIRGALAPCLTTSKVKMIFESGLLFIIYPKNELKHTLIMHAKTKADFTFTPKYFKLKLSTSIL